jgi:hypothetical protein
VDIGQLAIILICGILGVWYVGASIYNRRRGLTLARWLQAGLRSLGGKTDYKWIGSAGSGLRGSATGLAKPLKRLDAVLLLETRELLPLWLFQRMTGRRDQLILRCALSRGVQARLDAASRVGAPEGWNIAQVTPALQLATSGAAADELAAALGPFLEQYGPALRSFSYRPDEPQIVLALNLAGVETRPAEEMFQGLIRCLSR